MHIKHFSFLFTSSLILLLVMMNFSYSRVDSKELMELKSNSFKEGAFIAKNYTGDGIDISPSLTWKGIPKNTKSLAITCEDPDAPRGTWWHWIIYNIPVTYTSLSENTIKSPRIANGIKQGLNDFGKTGYNGPSPPAGKIHHYIFKLKALDIALNLDDNCRKDTFTKAISGHVLAEATLTGVYSR